MPDGLFGYLTFGIVLGLSAGLSPGPLMMVVLRETLSVSAVAGIRVACAPLITDAPIVLLSVFLLRELSDFRTVLGAIALAGGVFLIRLGMESLRTPPFAAETGGPAAVSPLRRGVLANFLSPHPYLFWMTVGAPLVLRPAAGDIWEPVGFLVGFYACLIGSKVAVAWLVGRFRDRIGGRAYVWTMRVLGLALLIMAVVFFIEAETYFFP